MPALANTFKTGAAVGNREELSNVIDMITPEDTPVYSMIGTGSCDSIHPEWEVDELRAPGVNAQLEGDEYSYGAITPPSRYGNYTQIFRDSFIISRTQNKVDNAGSQEKEAKQKVKIGKALRKDVEYSILSNTASFGGDPRVSAGLPTWLETSTDRGVGGADGGFAGGVTTVATDGTLRDLARAQINGMMQSVYSAGAEVKMLVMSPGAKATFSTFLEDAGVVPLRSATSRGAKQVVIGNVDIYLSPFGEIAAVPDRVMAFDDLGRNAFGIDPEKAEWLWLRPFAEDSDVSRTGDAEKHVVVGEGCLKVDNEAAHFVIADLNS